MREARETLHQLVGSGGIHGFMSLSRETARLLELAKSGQLAGRPEELETLRKLAQDALTSVVEDDPAATRPPDESAPASGVS